jgi:hypothetical protein
MTNPSILADPDRFQPIEDPRSDFPGLGFKGADSFDLDGEDLLITDPVFLADVYNPNDDSVAAYLRANGVIVYGFGGDDSCAAWWQDPFLVLPLSLNPLRDPTSAVGAVRVADEVGCDSGSFMFLPIRGDQPPPLQSAILRVLSERNGARVQLPPGRYRVLYEQHDSPDGWPHTFARNVVVCRQQ